MTHLQFIYKTKEKLHYTNSLNLRSFEASLKDTRNGRDNL